MRKLALTSILAMAVISGPALADDFLATCKANPAEDSTATPAAYQALCSCIDKETASDPSTRALFQQALKEKTVAKRKALGGAVMSAVVQKCAPNR